MKIRCPNCGDLVAVNGLGRKPLNITVTIICDALRLHRSVVTAANELGCSRAYIYKSLKVNDLSLEDVIKNGNRVGTEWEHNTDSAPPGKDGMLKQEIQIESIDIDPDLQVRFSIYPARVDYLKDLIRDGTIDPILVSKNGDGFILIDGWHRLEAAKQLGLPKIQATIEDIPESERYIRSFVANDKHGQPLTKDERNEFIIRQAKQGKTQKEIAKITNLNQSRISQIVDSININITDTKRKLRPSDYITVLKRSTSGETQETIATDFNVARSTISEVCSQLTNEITGRYKSGKQF